MTSIIVTSSQLIRPPYSIAKCEMCKHCVIKITSDPRCKKFLLYNQHNSDWCVEIPPAEKYVETAIARFDDFELCGSDGKYYEANDNIRDLK